MQRMLQGFYTANLIMLISRRMYMATKVAADKYLITAFSLLAEVSAPN